MPPAPAAEMGSIAVDKAVAKLGTPKDLHRQLPAHQVPEEWRRSQS